MASVARTLNRRTDTVTPQDAALAKAVPKPGGTWLDQITRDPRLDEAIATFVGSINFLRRVGLKDEEIQRLCRVNLLTVRRGPAR